MTVMVIFNGTFSLIQTDVSNSRPFNKNMYSHPLLATPENRQPEDHGCRMMQQQGLLLRM